MNHQPYKHVVISGGGISLFKLIGCFDILLSQQQPQEPHPFALDVHQLQSIYGTSAGAIVGTILALRFEWPWIIDYFIKRPWKDVVQINVQSILDSYSKRGIFDKKLLETVFKPLLDAKDLPLDVSLHAFYEFSHIDLHFFTLELNEYKIVDVSHTTHPDLSLLTALQMTCCLPVFFAPVVMDDKCYVDAGVLANYPLNYCVERYKEVDAILGIKNEYVNVLDNAKHHVTEDSSLLEYLMNLIYKVVWDASTEWKQMNIPHELKLQNMQPNTFAIMQKVIQLESERFSLFQDGQESARLFLQQKRE